MRFEITSFILRPPLDVFAFLDASERQPRERWSLVPGVPVHESAPSPRRELGLLGGAIRTMLVGREPPERLLFHWSGRSMDGDLEYLLSPDGEGTWLSQHMSLSPRGVFRRFEPMVRLAFHRASERRLARIKRHLESGSSHGVRQPRAISWPPDPDPTRGVPDVTLPYSRR